MRYGGSTEELCIRKIESGIRGIKNGTKTPEETRVGYFLTRLQPLNEGMHQDFGDFRSSGGRNPFGGFRFGSTGFGGNFGNFSGNSGPGVFDEFFSEFFRPGSGGRTRRPTSAPGQDVEYGLTIEFDQAYRGALVTVRILDRRIDVRIPAGVETGSRIRVGGQGAPGLRGGPPGDLYLDITVKPHRYFRREGKEGGFTVNVDFLWQLFPR